MPQKHQDDQRYGQHHLKDGSLNVANCAMNQLRAVIDRNDLDALWQSRRDLGQLPLDPVYDLESVLTAAHNDNAGDHFALAVQVRQAATQFRPFDHFAHVLDADRRAIFASLQHHVLEILEGLRIAAAPNHVLRAAELQQSPARLAVAFPHSLHYAANGNAVSLKPIGI